MVYRVCEDRVVAGIGIPKSPIGLAFALWRIWRRLPPRQRRRMLELAWRHGPRFAARAMQIRARVRRAR